MDEFRFGEMVVQYEKLIYTICYQLTRDHHVAQDLSQETFIAAFRHIGDCPEDNLKPWLARIATNKAKDHLKSAYNRRVTTPDEDALPEGKGNQVLFIKEELPEDLTIESETLEMIRSDIESLREPYRMVSILYFLEERTVDEIALRLDRPPKTVHTQLYRARRLLQDKLKGGGIDGAFPH